MRVDPPIALNLPYGISWPNSHTEMKLQGDSTLKPMQADIEGMAATRILAGSKMLRICLTGCLAGALVSRSSAAQPDPTAVRVFRCIGRVRRADADPATAQVKRDDGARMGLDQVLEHDDKRSTELRCESNMHYGLGRASGKSIAHPPKRIQTMRNG